MNTEILKYIFMVQMGLTCPDNTLTDNTQSNNSTLTSYTNAIRQDTKDHFALREALKNNFFRNAAIKLNSDIERKNLHSKSLEIRNYFNKVINFLSPFELERALVISLTSSDSIYLRFYNFPFFETHLEIFYEGENLEEPLEAVATVYKGETEILKEFGSLETVFDGIKKATNFKTETTLNSIGQGNNTSTISTKINT